MTTITVAVSEAGFQRAFRGTVDSAQFTGSASQDFGTYSVGYTLQAQLANGTIDFRADGGMFGAPNGAVSIQELDIIWERFDVDIGMDLPPACVGGFCLVPNLFGGCKVRVPRVCFFEGDSDVNVRLPIGALTRTELSVMASLRAKLNAAGSVWSLHIDPVTVDIDFMDWPDITGDMLEAAINDAINALVPAPLRGLVRGILGPVPDVMRDVLDMPDDIQEWLSRTLGVSLGLFDFIVQVVAEFFASKFPVQRIPTPYEILPADASHAAVSVAIAGIDIRVLDDEFVAKVEIGETP